MKKVLIFIFVLNTFIFALSNCQTKYDYASSVRKSNPYSIPIIGSILNGTHYWGAGNKRYWGVGESNKIKLYTFTKNMRIKIDYIASGCWGTNASCGGSQYYRIENNSIYDRELNVKAGDNVYAWSTEKTTSNQGPYLKFNWEEITDSMTYYTHSCPTTTNNQGNTWETHDPGSNCYLTTGDKLCSSYNPTNWFNNNSQTFNCRIQYQECQIDCVSPLTLNIDTGKCEMDFTTACNAKGMTYNSSTNQCEENNQCGNSLATKDEDSNFCLLPANCSNIVNGECTEDAIKYCSDNTFTYNSNSDLCEKPIACASNQILLPDGKCGSVPYCRDSDTQTVSDCVNATQVLKSCAPFDRDANLCFATQTGPDNFNIDTFRELSKIDVNGSFKIEEYGNVKNTYCSNDDGNCTFRLTEITTQNNGKDLCFKDNVGSNSCITIKGDCELSGSIINDKGIRQLRIENGNSIVGYNKAISTNSIGSIQSTCTISGKVGHEDTASLNREIIAASTNGIDIMFWDSYRRGGIGLITFLPTIPEQDLNDGYTYKEPEIMQLYNNNFTGFYTVGTNTYAVYNGLISKSECQSKINGTTFYIPQAQTENEIKTLNMLSLVGNNTYNYNDGNDASGSCVIKSETAKSFNEQDYSIRRVSVANSATKYVCSPLKCDNHTCQYNQCATNYNGNIFNQDDFDSFVQRNYPDSNVSDICIDNTCDSKKPYYPNCGSNTGCDNAADVFQAQDSRCVKVTCNEDEEFDLETNRCKKLGCKNSIERDGKCIKTLEL